MPTADVPRCPQCNAPLQPDWDWCHVCSYDPHGLRPETTPKPTPTAEPPPGPAPAPPDTEAPVPEAPARKRDANRPGLAGRAAAVAVAVVALVGLGLVVRSFLSSSDGPDSSFVAPEAQWRTFAPEDQSFRAFLPALPTATEVELDLGGGSVAAKRYEVAEGPDTITVVVADLAAVPSFADLAARTAADDGGTASKITELSVTGFPAADWTVTRGDGGGTTVNRAVLSGSRLFLVQVRGPEPPRNEIDRVLSGFVATS